MTIERRGEGRGEEAGRQREREREEEEEDERESWGMDRIGRDMSNCNIFTFGANYE